MLSNTPTPSDIVTAARKYLGCPFRHQGRVRAGMDCAGLLILVARDLGADPVDNIDYAHDPDPMVLRDYLKRQPFLSIVPNRNARTVGDLVLMGLSIRNKSRAHHLGILTDVGIIHAYAAARKVVETTLSVDMAQNILEVHRWQS